MPCSGRVVGCFLGSCCQRIGRRGLDHASCSHRVLFSSPSSFVHVQARQLKDYENAVIAKRLEELDEDEIQALLEEVEKDNF